MIVRPADLDRLQSECLSWWQEAQNDNAVRLQALIEEGRSGAFRDALHATFQTDPLGQIGRAKALIEQQLTARTQFTLSRIAHKMTTGQS